MRAIMRYGVAGCIGTGGHTPRAARLAEFAIVDGNRFELQPACIVALD